MIIKIVYKDNTEEKIEDAISIRYDYNGWGDIQITFGKYQMKEKTILTKDIERFYAI